MPAHVCWHMLRCFGLLRGRPRPLQPVAGREDTATTAAPRCRAGGTNPKYLTPSEVREVLRRMWELNAPILAFIYPTGERAGQCGQCG